MIQLNTNDAYEYFKKGAKYFIEKGDTINYLRCTTNLSDIEMRRGNFTIAFDLLFDVLPITNQISNKKSSIEIHSLLGILYGIYEKDSIALQHTKMAHNLSVHNIKTKLKSNDSIISSYLDVAVRYIEMKSYKKALQYLDSCYIINNSQKRLHFVDAHYGFIYTKQGNYPKAKEYFTNLAPFFENRKLGFQSSIYYFLAELKSKLKQSDSAIYYYKKSIKSIDSFQSNLKLKPIILEKLADAYLIKNNHKLAFSSLKEAKVISDSLYNTQSKQNKVLFEIKNKYKEDLIEKEIQIVAQNNLIASNNKAKFRLKLIIGILILLVIIGFIAFRLIYRMKRLKHQRNLEKQKNESILEIKNKELTTNALQLIEKEHAVIELLDTLKINDPEKFKVLNSKYKHSNKKIWNDFHLRFTQTNSTFYKLLNELYPELTSTDLKHCALIKLNFDSKEMSHLLGISLNSVHVARSRIRKKIGLKRNESLSNHLSKL
ncbi:hypothetical protein SAMN05444411_101409 [Lutibacter oricola]|uniref:Uncharacterized protein n=1 Tax=Lutibacter oricola TaxID=762486 RepID=A0A1H2S875_9FLAO|nr:hypothetical protein [Lutibacter oricola]SDW27726.1 hypothetical protein SAMN05444411_101409 [Lutibacter oricola]